MSDEGWDNSLSFIKTGVPQKTALKSARKLI